MSAVVCCKTATRGLNQIDADCRKCCFGNSCSTQANTLLGIFADAVSQKRVNVASAKVCKPGEGQPTVAVIFVSLLCGIHYGISQRSYVDQYLMPASWKNALRRKSYIAPKNS
jgi:hypothetical protein